MSEHNISRRAFLRGAAGAAAASAVSVAFPMGAAAARRPRPNLVYILADDLGYGALGAYGQQTMRTPNLDQLAAEGIRFTDAYCPAPICAPSRCCFLTGMHTGHARVRDNSFTETGVEPRLLPEDTTIAQVLKAAGYATGIFGKWGFGDDDAYVPLGNGIGCVNEGEGRGGPQGDLRANAGDPSHPLQKGFDEFVGFVRHHQATEGYYANYIWDGNRRVLLPENEGEKRGTFTPDLYVNRALEFMEDHRHEPFFLLLCPQLVHWPRLVPTTEPYSSMPWTENMKRYAAQHTLLDTYVGMVRKKLEELDVENDTIVFFTSDNGPTPEEQAAAGSGDCTEQLGPAPDSAAADKLWDTTAGFRGDKHCLYEGGIRVPMIVWAPGILRADRAAPAGRTWAAYDVLPTLADFAGVTPPSDVDGVSIRAWLTGESGGTVNHSPLYFERPPYMGLNADGSKPAKITYAEAARAGKWKGIRYAPGTDPEAPDDQWQFELYDLSSDPGELVNLAPLHPDVRAEIETIMKASHAPQPYARAPYQPKRADARAGSRVLGKRRVLPATGLGSSRVAWATIALAALVAACSRLADRFRSPYG